MSGPKFAMRDLLISPEGSRWIVADKGATWVSDRFVLVRSDLFKRVPGPVPPKHGQGLTVSLLRSVLGEARGPGKPLHSTGVAYIAPDGTRSRTWIAGCSLIFLNERVAKTFYLAGLRPRYIVGSATVAWYGTKRGRDVLMAVQKVVTPYGLSLKDLEATA